MSTVGSATASPTSAAQAVQAAQANSATGTTAAQTDVEKLGLPPVSLAQAASANTVNAELATSQWGVDPALVGGVYGGGNEDGGMFAGTSMLPVLSSISGPNAEQALAMLGIETPAPSAGSGTGSTAASTSGTALSAQDNAALAQAAAGSSGPAIVDPLWGKSA